MSELNTNQTVEETTEVIETTEKVGLIPKFVGYCKKNWKELLAAFATGAAVGGTIVSVINNQTNGGSDIIDLNEDEYVESDVEDVTND